MQNRILTLLMLVVMMGLTACASPDTSVGRFKVGKPYSIKGSTYYPEEKYSFEDTGLASWYGPGFHGKKTANGERFDENALTAAHKTLQLPSLVRVTNLENGKSIIVRVTDRGPFHGNRIIDLSKGAANALDFLHQGTAKVKIQVLEAESKALAEAARRKIDTTGAEIALNNTGMLDERFAAFYPSGFQKAQPNENPVIADSTIRTYQPSSPVEEAIAWNPAPPIDRIRDTAPAAGAPMSPPPQREIAMAQEPAIIRTRAGGARHPGIPVATLESNDVLPPQQPVRAQIVPVRPSAIYVQAGSFTSNANAQRAVQQVAAYGPAKILPAKFGSQPYYRVRIGPIETVEKADALVNTLARLGRAATIIVSEN